MRGDREHLVAVDELTALVDRDHAVGIAVEREPGVGARRRAPPPAARRGAWSRSRSLMLMPSGDALSTSTVAPSARSAVGAARNAAPLPQSTHHVQAVELTALERVDEGRDVLVERAAVLARHAHAEARRARRSGCADRERRAAPARPRARAARGSCARRRANSLTPLSAKGLWLAEITAAGRAALASAMCATPGVGSTPTSTTSAPSAQRPATSAASSIGPERRVSRPTTNGCVRRRGPAPRRVRAR